MIALCVIVDIVDVMRCTIMKLMPEVLLLTMIVAYVAMDGSDVEIAMEQGMYM